MGTQKPLNIQKGNLLTIGGVEKSLELGVILNHNDTAVLLMLEVVFTDIRINTTGDIRSGDHLVIRNLQEITQSLSNILGAVKPVVLGTGLGLRTIGIICTVRWLGSEC